MNEQLLREVARIAEAAYRRGFQHGHDTARRGGELAVHLHLWRQVPLHRSPSPHGGLGMTSEDRLRLHCPAIDRVLERAAGR